MAHGTLSSPKRVSPKTYTKKYYLEDCSGYDLFKKTNGDAIDDRLQKIVTLLPNLKNAKILDIGCGRGELGIYLAKKGNYVLGIDYSKNAIDLAKKALSLQSGFVRSRLSFLTLDLHNLESLKNKFDLIVCTEVWEHIYPDEQDALLKSVRTLLKPGGFVFIHTAPSRWFNEFTYPLWCYPVSSFIVGIWNRLYKKSYGNIPPPEELRPHYHQLMHVAEPDYFSFRATLLKNGFTGSIRSTNITVNKPIFSFKDTLYNFLVYLSPLSNLFPLNIFWGNDFWVLAKMI